MRVPMVLTTVSGTLTAGTPAWTTIAEVSGNDYLTHLHVESLLARNKISARLDGSKTYSLSVPAHDAASALRLISADVVEWGYPIRLILGPNHFVDHLLQDKHKTEQHLFINRPFDMVVNSPQFADDQNIRRALGELDERQQHYSFLRQIHLVRREYLTDQGMLAHGDEVTIDLSANPDPDSPSLSVSSVVWDNGQE
jgi:hypothetical protein